MSITLSISFVCYGLVALVSIVFGSIYLTRNQFMPYHSEALNSSWSDLKADIQVLILALMRAAGGGFLATGLAILFLLIFPWRSREMWSIYAITVISLCTSLGTLSATRLVTTKTPGRPPIALSLFTVLLTIIGFICSFL